MSDGPVSRLSAGGRSVWPWLDPRGRRLGGWAFIVNRLSGLGLVAYLYLHLVVLSLLVGGPDGWNAFVAFASSPVILVFDVVLLLGLLVHGLNGIRISLVGSGLLVDRQRALLVAAVVVTIVIGLVGGVRIFMETAP